MSSSFMPRQGQMTSLLAPLLRVSTTLPFTACTLISVYRISIRSFLFTSCCYPRFFGSMVRYLSECST